jgi:hypothetical protein
MIQVPGHTGIERSQSAGRLVRTNSEQSFMQLELSCSKSERNISKWTNRKQYEHLQSKYGQKYSNCFLQEISAQIISNC